MKSFFLIAGMCALLNAGAQAETLYRWVDSEGKVHYGDRVEPDAAGVVKKKFTSPVVTEDDLLSFEARRAHQNFPVTLYVAERCGDPCVKARDFLNKRGIPYTEKSLVWKEEIEQFRKLTGGNSVPAVTIGKVVLNGFEAGQWGSELDIAGYPKTPPIGMRLRPPPAKESKAESAVAPAAPAE